jgi:hypothetical protein
MLVAAREASAYSSAARDRSPARSVQVGRHCGVPGQVGAQAGPRSVGLADRHRAVEPYHRLSVKPSSSSYHSAICIQSVSAVL